MYRPRTSDPRSQVKVSANSNGQGWLPQLILSLLAICFIISTTAAQTPPTQPTQPIGLTRNCEQKPNQPDYWIKCAKHYHEWLASRDKWRLVTGSVAPGASLTGGVGYGLRSNYPNWQVELDSSARVSVKKYWELDANLRLTRTSQSGSSPVDLGNLKTNIYGFIKDMPRLDFFGIGPESKMENRAVYHYREGVVGADLSVPIHPRFNAGGAIEGIWPSLTSIANPSVTSVERKYTEASAPGLTNQSPYLHFTAFAKLRSSGQPEYRRLDYLFFYHVYQDVGNHRYSFRRFDADLRNKFALGKAYEFRLRARVSLSETTAGQKVPFYLMETLGGTNIRGEDTQRGFRDYRFRDRDLVLVQTEVLRKLYSYLDLIAFYDVGKVAPSFNRFDAGRLRHTYGLGIVAVPRRLDNILFRFYVAFGSGEGSRTYLGGGLSGRGDRLIR